MIIKINYVRSFTMNIEISMDGWGYKSKPDKNEMIEINNTIANNPTEIAYNKRDIKDFANNISNNGYAWCPCTFNDGQRRSSTFKQLQFLALDFDNGVTWDEVKNRADKYNLPIIFAYETYSSENCDRFRVVFLIDVSITDIKTAKVMLTALHTIFPESDKNCKDVVHIYLGSNKGLIYFDNKAVTIPTINIESLIMNMGLYLKDTYGANNYGREMAKFAITTGLAMETSTTLAVSVYHNEEDWYRENFSPLAISYIIRNGENFSKGYKLVFADNLSAINTNRNNSGTGNPHKSCRIPLDSVAQKCRLLHEYTNGLIWLHHQQLEGLATNLINIEGGRKCFLDSMKDIIQKHPEYDSYPQKYREFNNYYLSYFVQKKYAPMRCENYCPYRDDLCDENNILNDCICYFKPINLEDTKYIIASATADEDICKYLLGDNIKFYDCGKVENKGKQYQYNVPMSRKFIKKHPDADNIIKAKLRETLQKEHPELSMDEITEKVNNMPIISFKGHIPEARHWFGNVAGSNDYAGRDIIVAGTPHYPEYIYKLFAYSLGLDFDVDAKLRYQEIERNGFKFWFTTYDDLVLRNIQ